MFFTSDTHFGSERTLELSKRPFDNVEEMDNVIIERWNSIIKENDIVYHLGDFGDFERSKELNGKISLILGNYEWANVNLELEMNKANGDFNFLEKESQCILADYIREVYIKYNFSEVITTKHFIEIKKIGKIMLTHQPKDCDINYFNLFGHIHKLQMIKSYGLNVGVDCHYFKPITIEDVAFFKNGIENCYDENVFK